MIAPFFHSVNASICELSRAAPRSGEMQSRKKFRVHVHGSAPQSVFAHRISSDRTAKSVSGTAEPRKNAVHLRYLLSALSTALPLQKR